MHVRAPHLKGTTGLPYSIFSDQIAELVPPTYVSDLYLDNSSTMHVIRMGGFLSTYHKLRF